MSPEAQFTPKEVETKSEREKLMFRVKIQVPKELVLHYIERIKTGVRGVGYVKAERLGALAGLAAEEPDRGEQPPARGAAAAGRRSAGDAAEVAMPPVVSIAGVTHRYGKVVALDDISLEIPSGLMVGIIGPDGVGKSTLLALIAGSQARARRAR